ncbi:pre-rRNA-processing protein TSR2-like protein [Senna tora]|uniref:Pre-rRNA-processing protein TSR2-like protein n=1 Tax=Senna tora TaxID=362788 RepID=A0A834W0W6_9FABA|nr:pre-rRNA-processing protein TSR2-like protein [Senna tora]
MEHPRRLQAECIPIFREGVGLLLYRWSSLRTAVENEWGGRDSHLKAQQLGNHVFSWFTQSKEPLYIDDLENILDEGMLSLNVEVEDGSIEEVAEKLMVMHEECLEANFRSIEILREADLKQAARPHVMQVVNGDEDDEDDEDNIQDCNVGDDNSSSMMLDMPKYESNMNSENMPVNGHIVKVTAEADDGWVVVSSKKNKGRKS